MTRHEDTTHLGIDRKQLWERVRSVVELKHRVPSQAASTAGASRPILFLLDYLSCLVHYLDPDQPVHFLELGRDEFPQASTLETIARHNVDRIRSIQPDGPYFLSGQCVRGALAFEIACQLHAQGEVVAFLALIDTKFPQRSSPAGLVGHYGRRSAHHLRTLARLSPRQWAQYAIDRLRILRNQLERRLLESVGFAQSTYWHRMRAAAHRFTPRPFSGRITLFLAEEPRMEPSRDRRLEWVQHAEDGADIHITKGDHHTMIREPCVRGLAKSFGTCLRAAQSLSNSSSLNRCTVIAPRVSAEKPPP